MTGSAPVLAPQLQCPGLESLYSGMDAPTANCSVCFQKKRLHLPLTVHTNRDPSPAVLSSGTQPPTSHLDSSSLSSSPLQESAEGVGVLVTESVAFEARNDVVGMC